MNEPSHVVIHPRAAQAALDGVRFLHPQEMRGELAERLARKMENLAQEAFLDGHKRGFKAGWVNGATAVLAAVLLAAGVAAVLPYAP